MSRVLARLKGENTNKFLKKISFVKDLGEYALFTWSSLLAIREMPFRFRVLVDEIEFVGVQSLFIIFLTSLFTGAVLAYQSWLALSIVGTQTLVGVSVALSLLRELGPVMTSIVVAGRAGAAMAAKIGIMRVTSQIDALELMAISPKQYLVTPKLYASIISTPLLCAIFCLIGCLGGYVVGVGLCNIDAGIYVEKTKSFINPMDLYHGLIKSVIFGLLLSSVSCYKGYKASNGAEGVGRATNESVVVSIVAVLVLDYFLTMLIPTGRVMQR
jgi:phospholipid/cholesterol/gamma-HCH transport system permease protein